MPTPRERLEAALTSTTPSEALDALVQEGWAEVHLPELPQLRMEQKTGWRHKDVYRHTLQVVDNSAALGGDLLDRIAALFHDFAKPATRAFEEGGEVTFYGHDVLGGRVARKRLEVLGYEKETVETVVQLVEMHLRAFGYTPGKWTDAGLRRFDVETGELQGRLIRLFRSDITTGRPEQRAKLLRNLDDLEERIADVRRRDAEAAIRPALDGEQVMALLGIGPGREVGAVLKRLLDLKKAGVELSDEEAEAEVLQTYRELVG